MAVIKQFKGRAVIRLKAMYICLDMETGNVLCKGSLAECSKALEEV